MVQQLAGSGKQKNVKNNFHIKCLADVNLYADVTDLCYNKEYNYYLTYLLKTNDNDWKVEYVFQMK